MEKHFYVSDGLNKVGPFSKDEVYQMLFNAHISITDFILDSRDNRMCPLLQHEDFGGAGDNRSSGPSAPTASTSTTKPPQTDQFGFAALRKQGKVLRSANAPKERIASPTKAPEKIAATTPVVKEQEETVLYNTNAGTNTRTLAQISNLSDLTKISNTFKNNNSLNFYVKTKDKEFGPLKFLVLLSLLKQNKLKTDIPTRTENEKEYKNLSHFLPKELLQTINVTPIFSPSVLPKNQWLRKNVRIDYDDIVLLNNKDYSLVGRSIDLSSGGISIIWFYDFPLNEKFEICLFDPDKNLVKVEGYLARKETLPSNSDLTLYKAVFLFNENIQIKTFIK